MIAWSTLRGAFPSGTFGPLDLSANWGEMWALVNGALPTRLAVQSISDKLEQAPDEMARLDGFPKFVEWWGQSLWRERHDTLKKLPEGLWVNFKESGMLEAFERLVVQVGHLVPLH